jgi:flagellar biosynthesis/type III secretory pathway chaperone
MAQARSLSVGYYNGWLNMDFNLASLISHGTTQDVLLAIVALFLKSAVKLLQKIHSVFVSIEVNLQKVVTQNDQIMKQNDKIADKVTVLHAANGINPAIVKRAKKSNGSAVAAG